MALMEENDIPNPKNYTEYLASLGGYTNLSLPVKFALLSRVKEYEKASRDQLIDLIIELDVLYEYSKATYVSVMGKSLREFSNDSSILPDSLG